MMHSASPAKLAMIRQSSVDRPLSMEKLQEHMIDQPYPVILPPSERGPKMAQVVSAALATSTLQPDEVAASRSTATGAAASAAEKWRRRRAGWKNEAFKEMRRSKTKQIMGFLHDDGKNIQRFAISLCCVQSASQVKFRCVRM